MLCDGVSLQRNPLWPCAKGEAGSIGDIVEREKELRIWCFPTKMRPPRIGLSFIMTIDCMLGILVRPGTVIRVELHGMENGISIKNESRLFF